MTRRRNDESLAYHAARILVLTLHAGSPRRGGARRPGIRGRTLLAKLDFFIRYPVYLEKAAVIRSSALRGRVTVPTIGAEGQSVESRMIRYLYGPWDDAYFNVLAYLVGKQLVQVDLDRGIEVFRLTARGADAAEKLSKTEEYAPLAARARTVSTIFPGFRGTALKDFIYLHFPEVVSRKLGAPI